jgi:hypothetical protein
MATEFTIRKLKFGILECLASDRSHQNKFNLIGKGYSQSPLELAVAKRLDPAQRHHAVIAFNELEQAELIRPMSLRKSRCAEFYSGRVLLNNGLKSKRLTLSAILLPKPLA